MTTIFARASRVVGLLEEALDKAKMVREIGRDMLQGKYLDPEARNKIRDLTLTAELRTEEAVKAIEELTNAVQEL